MCSNNPSNIQFSYKNVDVINVPVDVKNAPVDVTFFVYKLYRTPFRSYWIQSNNCDPWERFDLLLSKGILLTFRSHLRETSRPTDYISASDTSRTIFHQIYCLFHWGSSPYRQYFRHLTVAAVIKIWPVWRPSRTYSFSKFKTGFCMPGGCYPWNGSPFNVPSDGHTDAPYLC